MVPSIFGENLFDDFFGRDFDLFPALSGSNPLYGKHAKNLMKTVCGKPNIPTSWTLTCPALRRMRSV